MISIHIQFSFLRTLPACSFQQIGEPRFRPVEHRLFQEPLYKAQESVSETKRQHFGRITRVVMVIWAIGSAAYISPGTILSTCTSDQSQPFDCSMILRAIAQTQCTGRVCTTAAYQSATASPFQRPGGTQHQNEEQRELESSSKCHVCLYFETVPSRVAMRQDVELCKKFVVEVFVWKIDVLYSRPTRLPTKRGSFPKAASLSTVQGR